MISENQLSIWPALPEELRIGSTDELIALAVALGARRIPGWSKTEEQLVESLPAIPLVQLRGNLCRVMVESCSRTFSLRICFDSLSLYPCLDPNP